MQSRNVFVAAVVLAAGLVGQPTSAAEPTLNGLASRYRESLSGMHTLEMRYRVSVTTGGNESAASDCEWLRQGDKTRLIMNPGKSASGWWSFDGRHGYSVDRNPVRPEDIRGIVTSSSPPNMLELSHPPADWLGLHVWTDPPTTLSDLLAGKDARLAGTESFGELAAYRVDLGVHDRKANGRWAWSAVLCPERDGLPTEIACSPNESNPKHASLSESLGRIQFFVSEFRQVDDKALKRTRWVPWKMSLEIGKNVWNLEASSVLVNHEIPANAFAPPLPQAGTELIDETVPGERKIRVHQPRAAVAKNTTAAIARSHQPPPDAGPIPAATPPNPAYWSWAALWGGALCLLGAAVFYFVRSRGER